MSRIVQMSDFWNRGVNNVPITTGASRVMDCSDIKEVLAALHIAVPLKNVLDVGCGTGRLSQLCDGYLGVDLASDAVEYCRTQGLQALEIDGPDDLPEGTFDIVTCLSVFTHISPNDRISYLSRFQLHSRQILVDILPGGDYGNWAAWYADTGKFEEAFTVHGGWKSQGTYSRNSPDGVNHRYYHLTR